MWKKQPSVYGPIATAIQAFAATIGGSSVATTIWMLMILNGAAFIGVGWLLLKTSDDPVRATLFWIANPVLMLALVGGGHLDTFVARPRSARSRWRGGLRLVGRHRRRVLIGLGCGIKIYAVLIGPGSRGHCSAPRMDAHRVIAAVSVATSRWSTASTGSAH